MMICADGSRNLTPRVTYNQINDGDILCHIAHCNTNSFNFQAMMYPLRHNKYSYVINTSILSVMPGMMTLLPPSVKKFMGNKNIALKYGIILTGEVGIVCVT